jgi:hypothetical protein
MHYIFIWNSIPYRFHKSPHTVRVRPTNRGYIRARSDRCVFSKASRSALWTMQPPTRCAPGTLLQTVKRPGREADYSRQSSVRLSTRKLPPWHNSFTPNLTIRTFNLSKTKRNLLYIRNQSVPHCKHYSPCL